MKNHVKYSDVAPFPFYKLSIRELSPMDYERMSVAEVSVPPGAEHPKARSSKSDKLYICLTGIITFLVDGEALQLKPLDVLLIRKGQWFSYKNSSDQGGRLLLVHSPPFDRASEEIAS